MADNSPMVWPALKYDDAPAAVRFLTALGFTEKAAHTGESPDVIHHAELRWPSGGGVMLGSRGAGAPEFEAAPRGSASVYVVTDDPEDVHARAIAAGAVEVIGLRDQEYGSREFTVQDPEGNLWSFGTYRGA